MRPEDLFPEGSPFVDVWKGFYQAAIHSGRFGTEYEVFTGTNVLALNLHRLERDGAIFGVYVFAKNITQAWQARQQLDQDRRHALEMQRRSSLILDTIPQSVFWKDLDGRYLGCNIPFARFAGFSHPDDIVGKTDFDLPWPERQALAYRADDQEVIASNQPRLHIEEPIQQADGTRIVATTSKVPLVDNDGSLYGVLGIFDDITQRKQAEIALERTARILRTLSQGNEALVRATDEADLLRRMVRIIVETGGYGMAWVGYAEHDEDKYISEVACHADSGVPPQQEGCTWEDGRLGQGLVGKVVRSGKALLERDIMARADMSPWREQLQNCGYVAALALPLSEGGQTFGVLSIFARDSQAFATDELQLLEELANDLAYGIVNLRGAIERSQAVERLRRNLEQTIGVIAATVESRDPFTAGHQRRVAELAVAIGREMGLSEHAIEGIRFGALIHDLGNVQIPAGILARPAQLMEVEFELIKAHPQIGSDIIKDIDFPWPVAKMIQQHHERLDGSGYPHGLRGDAISLEARILAVADVVEAITSHRPYRPARSLDDALAEIVAQRDILYDARVVDACVALWREKDFAFTAAKEEWRNASST